MKHAAKIKKTSGGLPAVEEIPDELIEQFIISVFSSKPLNTCKLENIALDVFKCAGFAYRGSNKDVMIRRIWSCVDHLLKQGSIIQYQTATMTKIKLNPAHSPAR
ncbi:MAG: hypothetical protein KKE73_09030 [Proteobacteria bacterium]|nr:hypothetical protein [Pseudomonadota bacterium]